MEPKDYVILIVGLLTFAVGCFNAWVTYSNRSSQHRDLIYKKQIETYEEMLNLMAVIHREFLSELPKESTSDEIKNHLSEKIKAIRKDGSLFTFLTTRYFILPKNVQDSINSYLSVVFSTISSTEKTSHEELEDKLTSKLISAGREARSSLGIEALSEDILSITSKKKLTYPNEIIRILSG